MRRERRTTTKSKPIAGRPSPCSSPRTAATTTRADSQDEAANFGDTANLGALGCLRVEAGTGLNAPIWREDKVRRAVLASLVRLGLRPRLRRGVGWEVDFTSRLLEAFAHLSKA